MAKYDWKALKTEWVTGNALTLSAFFKAKGIKLSTWIHRTRGWIKKRKEQEEKTLDLAVKKSAETQAKRLAKRADDAQNMMDGSLVVFSRKKGKMSARQAAEVYKIASEVQDKATKPLNPPPDLPVQPGFAIGLEFDQDELKSVRIVAKSIANSQAGIREG